MHESTQTERSQNSKSFLGVQFVNCGIYGRIYKNKKGDAYVGRCPRCMTSLRIGIDPGQGISCRFFKFSCP